MKLQIRDRNIEVTEILRAHVERRFASALGRFGERIGRVVVLFSDLGDERGGTGRRCQIEVGVRLRGVRIKDTDADLFAAVNWVADRASRSIGRVLEQELVEEGERSRQGTKPQRSATAKRPRPRRGAS